MRRVRVPAGILFGVLTSTTVIALSYLGGQYFGLPFFPFDLFEFATRVLPGPIVTFGIGAMVSVLTALQVGPLSQAAKAAEQAMALVQFLAIGAVFGAILTVPVRHAAPRNVTSIGVIGGAVVLALTLIAELALGFPATASTFISIAYLTIIHVAWGVALVWLLSQTSITANADGGANRSRRNLLITTASALVTLAAAAIGIVDVLGRINGHTEGTAAPAAPGAQAQPAATPTSATSAMTSPLPTLPARLDPAPDTRPELTANKDFYRVDINLIAPMVSADTWRLELTGLVERPLKLTLEQVRMRPAFSQYITQSCISNPLGGDLISTTQWTGIRLKDLLMEAGLKPGVVELAIQAADGFYESVGISDMMDERTLLVYAMNGAALPVEHGFPLRIYIPNRYGMKQPKWITRLEAIDHEGPGYWVDRGWSATAYPQTTSVVDTAGGKGVAHAAPGVDGTISLGGIAWAGARGISKVEVQVDEGEWAEARLRMPPLSALTWVQWRYDWPATAGVHTARVRAYDGTGKLQVVESHDVYPSGATGISSLGFQV
ncbi:MAG: molybdopterin-dependent oxidoreductase [Chloroflexi bacterium]|nr:molybdopterin-dependent oxidoreductase [Chloroflexota bacterium]MCL5274448.1 molybdopterin-dependent oxidoreductase [Chloroflexota bacterium]